MKKAYTLSKTSLLAMLMILSVVFACKDDDKDDPTPPSNDPIVATWELQAIAPATAGTTIPNLALVETQLPCLYDLKLTFKSDNTIATADCPNAVALIDGFVPLTGSKWEVKDGNITFKNDVQNVNKTFKYTINGSDLEIFVDDLVLPGSPAIDVILKLKKV